MGERGHRFVLNVAVRNGQNLINMTLAAKQKGVAACAAHSKRVPISGGGQFELPAWNNGQNLVGRWRVGGTARGYQNHVGLIAIGDDGPIFFYFKMTSFRLDRAFAATQI